MGLRVLAERIGLGRDGGADRGGGVWRGDKTQTLKLVRARYGWKEGRCEAACMGVRALAALIDK